MPSLPREIIDPTVLGKLLALDLKARRPMLGSVSGRHRSPVRGSALEFAQYRKYVPGDDLRRLDWRTWGRTDRYYIKETEADTNLRLCFLIDLSGSMAYGDEGSTRLDYACRMAGTLAYLAVKQGDAAGLYAAGPNAPLETPPRRGARHLGLVLDRLAHLEAKGEVSMAESIHQLAEKIGPRAMVVVISDLFEPPEPLQEAFHHLHFRKHDVVLFHLLDRREVDFPFDRPTQFLDLEGGPPLFVDPSTVATRYREAVLRHLNKVDEIVARSAVDYHRIFLDEPYSQALARFLLGRSAKTSSSAR